MRLLPCFLFLLLFFQLPAQQLDIEDFKGIKARSIGPAGMSGRVTAIDVIHDQPETILVGTASGGLWQSKTGGVTWKPIFDKEDVASIGAIAINQSNPSEIWVGTGEGNPRNSHNSGIGIYKTIDGGKTWKNMGLPESRLIHRIIIHRDNPNIVFVATLGSAWGPNRQRGVFKTTDGGKSWKNVLFIDHQTGCADLVVDPQNPNKLIAAMWEFGRKPWTFNSGGKGSGLHITYDAGKTWELIKKDSGLPKGDFGRIGLAIAPSKPNIVYAYVEAEKNALYASKDGGHKWEKRGDKNMGNRPFYYADIFVDPENENRIYSLHSTVTSSEDGGKNWFTLIPYSGVHPDHHALWIHPTRPNYMIEGNDGGLNITHDKGKTWRFIENLPLAQFYHINYDMDFPYNVYGGMQDNGSWVGPSSVLKAGGIRNSDWQEVLFGDGFDVVPYSPDNRFGYAMSQGGNVYRYDRETGRNEFIKPIHPDGKELRFNWNAAIAQDPFTDCGLYFGTQYVHYSSDCGKSWKIISPDLTSNDPEKQKQAESGGLTIDATQAENFTTILSIAPSPVDEKVVWVGTDDGYLQLTRDGGENWSNLSARLPGFPEGSWIPQIVPSENNPSEVFVVVNDYRRDNWNPYLYHTTDYGRKWRRLVNGQKVEGYCRAVVQDPKAENHLWLGTDQGLYFSIDKGSNWNKWTNEFPSVNVSDLKIHPREEDLIIGTFGRSAYILDDIRPFRDLANTNAKILEDSFYVFPAPDAYLTSFRSVDGVRFGADGTFKGTNKRRGASLTFWIKPKKENGETEKPTKEDKKEKIKIKVLNSDGDTIRNYSINAKEGMFRGGWDLHENGVRFPSWNDPKPKADPRRGRAALAGEYKIICEFKNWKDSTLVKVHNDPRQEMKTAVLTQVRKHQDELGEQVSLATEAFNQLKKAKGNINGINKMLSEIPDSTQKSLKKLGGEHIKMIDSLARAFMLPKDFKGLDHISSSLNRTLYRANSYINSSVNGPGENTITALKLVESEVGKTVSGINEYLKNTWPKYEKAVKEAKIPLMKSLKILTPSKE